MASYTINEIPDTATGIENDDLAVVWQNNATKKISILNLLKTLVKKSEVTNTVSALSESVITSKGVSSLLTIPASNTTITNAPPLQNNATYRFFFTEQITGSDDTSALSISYNGTSYSVKATSNGSLKDFTAYPIATEQTRGLKKGEKSEEEKGETKSGTSATVTTYVYCQAYTTLEMMFDGTQFIIMGNPVVISNSDYTVYTDGSITYTNKIRQLTIADISYDSNKFQIDTDYTKLYYNDYQFWGVLWFTTLQNIGAWGSQITFTKLKNIFKMKHQFLRSALGDNTMISVEDFTTTSNTISANTTIGLFFSIGIEHK